MKKKFNLILLASMAIAITTSCGEDEVLVEEAVETVVEEQQKTPHYQIPSPDEMLEFINKNGLVYNEDLLNAVENSSSYNEPQSQALNFGIYSADLAYMTAYEKFDKINVYFDVIRQMAEPIGLSSAFDASLVERTFANIGNPDSLSSITNALYFKFVTYLENNEQENVLGLIASAGWLETVYITVNTIDYSKNKDAVDRLADQKLTLDNLLDYLETHKTEPNVAETMIWFQDLELVFSQLSEENNKEASLEKSNDGKMVLTGGASISMSEEQFKAIKNKVNQIRNNIVKI